MDERGASEAELRAWLDRRFPRTDAAGDRLAEGDRHHRRRLLLVRLLPVVVVVLLVGGVALGILVVHRQTGATPVPQSSGDAPVTVLVAVVLGWVVAFALQGYCLWRLRRAHLLLARAPQVPVARALTRRQRRELMDEIGGRRAVVAGDEPVLDHLARGMVAQGWLAVSQVGLAVLLLINLLVASWTPSRVALTLVPVALLVASIVLLLRDRRRALEYLRRRERDQAGVPLAP